MGIRFESGLSFQGSPLSTGGELEGGGGRILSECDDTLLLSTTALTGPPCFAVYCF